MRRVDRRLADLDDGALLDRLLEDGPERRAAWRAFLNRYTELILNVAWQLEHDHDVVMERYLYVCSRLAEDDFQRLRQFDPASRDRAPKLSTWLTVVVCNLCIEQYRRQEGRRRFPRALTRLSGFHRRVFRLYYWEGYSVSEIEHIVAAFGEEQSVAEALRRIEALALRPSRTWNRPADRHQFIEYAERHGAQNGHPEAAMIDAEQQRWLESILDQMPREERLVVRLRFWDELSGSQIARLLQMTPRRVYYVLSKALGHMREQAQTRTADG